MTERICSIDTCPKPLHKKGWCTTHYSRWYETGDPETPLTRIPKSVPLRAMVVTIVLYSIPCAASVMALQAAITGFKTLSALSPIN